MLRKRQFGGININYMTQENILFTSSYISLGVGNTNNGNSIINLKSILMTLKVKISDI